MRRLRMSKKPSKKARETDEFGEPTHPACVAHSRGYLRDEYDGEEPNFEASPEKLVDYGFTWKFSDLEYRTVWVRASSYSKAGKLARARLPEMFGRYGATADLLTAVEILDGLSELRQTLGW